MRKFKWKKKRKAKEKTNPKSLLKVRRRILSGLKLPDFLLTAPSESLVCLSITTLSSEIANREGFHSPDDRPPKSPPAVLPLLLRRKLLRETGTNLLDSEDGLSGTGLVPPPSPPPQNDSWHPQHETSSNKNLIWFLIITITIIIKKLLFLLLLLYSRMNQLGFRKRDRETHWFCGWRCKK